MSLNYVECLVRNLATNAAKASSCEITWIPHGAHAPETAISTGADAFAASVTASLSGGLPGLLSGTVQITIREPPHERGGAHETPNALDAVAGSIKGALESGGRFSLTGHTHAPASGTDRAGRILTFRIKAVPEMEQPTKEST